ncbi:Complex I intermediate-associated protein 30 [Metarhizium acridum CQMa 102]|uniref:Complex I intermediate-associated protein 30 n=1 Tax=Metarhizium acridum (strain CQMa 102) TaxID=655827 RepID=E9EIZ3_METAQ|nr:Complex I intermediate-associated protein 30 [Metarhizium acridum CQMa 102]EFY84117.1 Complex I intermediate-associated protein 30 [Metarhizium acridum CQMa 102]
MPDQILYLYGGDRPWTSDAWVASDDRVRGGASQSYLSVESPQHARFHGHLDTTALGGAGFASQHSQGTLSLNLEEYEGIIVSIRGPDKADGKKYALTLKDEILPPGDDGREQSTVSWEAEFVAKKPGDVKLRWADFKPTYRGREKKDAGELDLADIKRIGLMMRSFFGEQEGDFELHLFSISAFKHVPYETDSVDGDEKQHLEARHEGSEERAGKGTWWKSLLCGLV